jgi:hypothetical protein
MTALVMESPWMTQLKRLIQRGKKQKMSAIRRKKR